MSGYESLQVSSAIPHRSELTMLTSLVEPFRLLAFCIVFASDLIAGVRTMRPGIGPQLRRETDRVQWAVTAIPETNILESRQRIALHHDVQWLRGSTWTIENKVILVPEAKVMHPWRQCTVPLLLLIDKVGSFDGTLLT